MNSDKIEYLREKIKRTYKKYKEDETKILELSSFFNIPIDEARIGDYVVNNISYSIPKIEITDQKNDVFYTATYTGDADLLNYSGPIQFNSVVSISPSRKEEKLYYIKDKNPIVARTTFTDGDYNLVLECEKPTESAVTTRIRYLQNVNHNGKNVKQPLLNKIYRNSGIASFEQTYTYGLCNFIRLYDKQDKYAYTNYSGVIYGINELEQKDKCKYLRGICFESANISKANYLPLGMDIKNYPLLTAPDVNSAMIFKFGTGFGRYYSLQAYKSEDKIKIMYSSIKYQSEEDYEGTIVNKEYSLPNLSNGTISNEEIKTISSLLKIQLEDNKALETILGELNTFGTKINIRKGLVQEEIDPISPKLFMNKTFDEICSLVDSNKDYYFNLIKGQFETLTNANQKQEEKPKILRLNNAQNNKK